MINNRELSGYLQDFFSSHLIEQRGLSPHTLKSYRDTFTLFLRFTQRQKGTAKPVVLSELNTTLVLDFLKNLEDPVHGRGNNAQTRNLRLAAIHAFFKYLSWHGSGGERRQANKILAIPFKKMAMAKLDYLNRQELEAVFSQVNTKALEGFRDFTLLTYMYNTGCRSQEAASTRISEIDFSGQTVAVTGKGRKQRLIPLWPTTIQALRHYLERYRRRPKLPGKDHLFISQRGMPLTRFGVRRIIIKYLRKAGVSCESLKGKRLSTHSLRHTCAVHLLESDVEPNVIKAWLGHSSLNATSRYLDADLTRKKAALEKFGPPVYVTSSLEQKPASSTDDILSWLKSF